MVVSQWYGALAESWPEAQESTKGCDVEVVDGSNGGCPMSHRSKDVPSTPWQYEVVWILNGRMCRTAFTTLSSAKALARDHRGILVEYFTHKVIENHMEIK
jgi:hypothetical protein